MTFVMTGDLSAASEMVYGLTPPVTVSPQGSQVLIVVVTLAWILGGLFGVGGWQVVVPAKYIVWLSRQRKGGRRLLYVPVTS